MSPDHSGCKRDLQKIIGALKHYIQVGQLIHLSLSNMSIVGSET